MALSASLGQASTGVGQRAAPSRSNGTSAAVVKQRSAMLEFATRQRQSRRLEPARAGAPGAGAVPVGAWAAAAAAIAVVLGTPDAQAVEDVGALFTKTCAGCHVNGGNIIRRDATLALGDLQKFGLADTEALYSVIYGGRGSMPGYGQDCTPKGKCTFGKRLADEEIAALATYVLDNAEKGWPQE